MMIKASPAGGYGVILADPPWRYRSGRVNGAAGAHYPTMTLAELCALSVADLAAPDSILFCWATWPHLPDALTLIKAWGFKYVTGLPWIKFRGEPAPTLFGEVSAPLAYGTGFWLRGCSEACLIAKRGRPRRGSANVLGIISERFNHSRKPENIYELAEACDGPYLELFARRQRDGWHAWGNEIASDIRIKHDQSKRP